ncbi:hypothetical protein WK13_34565 [Burkholderia ubonensis]|uniref:hypothetical protein n=1 Tax=Burkholderia ubonensis TaxID=101571 RepID=UPI00075BA2C3|nr:hypothetical protein [Burkholderia ubonensis]KVR21663.1 hypothetical protein WK13_34565 [Burkholderia ubonensis]
MTKIPMYRMSFANGVVLALCASKPRDAIEEAEWRAAACGHPCKVLEDFTVIGEVVQDLSEPPLIRYRGKLKEDA